MTFEDILDQAIAMLQRRGRLTYSTLKRQFHLDDAALEDLKSELIKGQRLARDEDGEVLVWTGAATSSSAPAPTPPPAATPAPLAYTPPYLAEKILATRSAMEGERKQVTVLFADLKGNTELIRDLDPETAQQLLDTALQHMMDAVHRFEGTVNDVAGDGIMAMFGAPIAHEDHALRACYAALAMQAELRRYAEVVRRTQGLEVLLRVGLNSGDVLVRTIGNDLYMNYSGVGLTTNLAARMEQLAPPGSIRLTAATLRLVEGLVQVNALGQVPVRGLTEPVEVFELTGTSTVRRRLQASVARGLTPFVGRQQELAVLTQAPAQAAQGHGQVVAVVGEPGVGKSRLVYEFLQSHHTPGWLVLESASVSYGKATPYFPVIDLLKRYSHVEEHDDTRTIRAKVTGQVLTLDPALQDAVPALLSLLDALPEDSSFFTLDPPQRRQRTLDALKRVVLRESQEQPLLLVFEDLHWIDAETQALLDSLVESLPTARLLLLVNYRPEYQHGWGSKTYYVQLRLDPLPPVNAEELLQALLGDNASLAALAPLLITRTEGNPFFLEESVRTLVETGVLVGERGAYRLAQALPTIQVPTTVQAVLAARIDRLPPEEKALLQTLAVIGKEFALSLLTRVVEQPEDEVQQLLAHLRGAEFIYEQPAFPEPEYTFKHTLTQEVAYNALLLERRRGLHERTGQAIEALFPSRLAEHYGTLAHHYSRSGNAWKAVEYLQLAGQQARQQSAYAEAIGHITTALELLETLPDTMEHAQRELALLLTLGQAMSVTKGYTAPETARAYARARELGQQVGEPPQLFAALTGYLEFYRQQAKYQTAHELAEQLLRLAQHQRDPALLETGHQKMGLSLLWLGELSAARSHLEQAIALDDPQQQPAAVSSAWGSGVFARQLAPIDLWLLGYPEQARERSYEALTRARELARPTIIAYALCSAAWLHQYRREGPLAQEQAEACMTLATEHGFAPLIGLGTLMRGSALAAQGQGEQGIAHLRQGLAAYRAVGAEEGRTIALAFLAEAYGNVGQTAEGLNVLGEALAFARTTGERMWEAELHRLKGELLLQSDVQGLESGVLPRDAGLQTRDAEAEASFRQALDVARRQQAKSLELRAAMSLSRLWHRQGKRIEARELLAPVYGWFTEGFDTADLQEAKILLDALA
jgi:predicted ATPase/class 3 adenylate cyclase